MAGCALETPPPTTGYLPDNAFGGAVVGQDSAVAATDTAEAAFAQPAQTHGQPARMALAIACLDAMAGQFSTNGRWLGMDDAVKLQMLDARDQVRAALGVPRAAESQTVIDQLLAAAQALDAGNQGVALKALAGPDFTLGPAPTLALLTNFPNITAANTATIAADQNLFPHDDENVGF